MFIWNPKETAAIKYKERPDCHSTSLNNSELFLTLSGKIAQLTITLKATFSTTKGNKYFLSIF